MPGPQSAPLAETCSSASLAPFPHKCVTSERSLSSFFLPLGRLHGISIHPWRTRRLLRVGIALHFKDHRAGRRHDLSQRCAAGISAHASPASPQPLISLLPL